MNNLLWGIGVLVASSFIYWIYLSIKAMKDPDVQTASNLRMSIRRYRKYQKLYDEYDEFMRKHGVHSKASEEKFKEIFKQIDNPNEWRRYQNYRYELSRRKMFDAIYQYRDWSDESSVD